MFLLKNKPNWALNTYDLYGETNGRTDRSNDREEQVAQGQYVVSDTRCPALSDCELSEGKQGSGPEGDEVL